MNPDDLTHTNPYPTIKTTTGVNAETLVAGDTIEYDDTDYTITAVREITTFIGPRIEVEADNTDDDTRRVFHFFRGATVWLVMTDSAL